MTACSVRQNDSTGAWKVHFRRDGKSSSRSFDTEQQAEQWAAIVRAAGIDEGLRRLSDDSARRQVVTVAEVLDHHLRHLVVKPGTRIEYEAVARRTWLDHLGPLPVHAVTRDSIVRWVRWASEDRDPPLSPKSISNAHGLLSAVMRSAVERDLIPANPCRGVRMPRDDDPHEKAWLTEEQFGRLVEELPAWYRPLVILLGATGMRFGEATALQWRDVTWTPARITVRRGWHRVGGGWQESSTKTRRSVRVIRIPPAAVAALEQAHAQHPDPQPDALVFVTARAHGRVWPSRFLKTTWHPARERAGLPVEVTPHSLRDSHVAWLVARGVPLPVIQRRLGHEKITTTIDTYGHLVDDLVDASVDAAGDALSLTSR